VSPVLLKSILLVFLAGVVGSYGAVFLKMGAVRLNGGLLSFLNGRLVFGVALYLGSSVIYAAGLRGGQLSVLYPMVSLGYIWTILWARLFFHEAFTGRKVAGLGLILLGVALVGLGEAAKAAR